LNITEFLGVFFYLFLTFPPYCLILVTTFLAWPVS